jgi:hypothetical protein
MAITLALLSLKSKIKVHWKAKYMPLVVLTNLTFDHELIKMQTFNFLEKIYFMHRFNHLKAMLQISVWDCLVIRSYYNI